MEPRLTLGAALGAAPRSSARVRQARRWGVPCRRDGRVVLDLDDGNLGLLRRSLGQCPGIKARSTIRVNERRIKTKLKKIQNFKSLLLFLVVVVAQGGE